MMSKNGNFIGKLYYRALFPNIVAVLGGTVNVFFDGIFIGRKLGDTGLESVNQCLPIYLLLCTVGSLYASGASFLSSHALGKNDAKDAERIFHGALLDALTVGGSLCLLGFIFAGNISELLGTAESRDYVYLYLRITLIGGIAKILLYIPYFYLRLEGKNRQAMAAMLTMTVLNIVLDLIFLFVFDLGISGAAWASVIATAAAAAMSFLFLWSGNSTFKPGVCFLRFRDRAAIFRYGSPMALNNLLSSARIFAVNLVLGSMNTAGLVSVFAIVNNLNEFSICVQNGVPQTAAAMTGIFYGERDSEGVKRIVKTELFSGTVLSLALAAVFALFPSRIGAMFGSGADCAFAVRCLAVSLVLATANSVMTYTYNAVGQLAAANVITVCRSFAAVAGFALLFRGLRERIWLFYPCSELLTFVLIVAGSIYIARKKRLAPFYLIDDSLEKNGGSISFTVECTDEKICEASERLRSFCKESGFDKKETMVISLALEELLTIITQNSRPPDGFADVRLLVWNDKRIIRIRAAGKRYDPIETQDGSLDYMGVKMICGLAERTEYLSALGVNTLIIYI